MSVTAWASNTEERGGKSLALCMNESAALFIYLFPTPPVGAGSDRTGRCSQLETGSDVGISDDYDIYAQLQQVELQRVLKGGRC